MRTKVAIASFLVILMAGVSASSTFHNFPDAVNQKQSHTQNVDFNWDWSSIISGSEEIVSDDIGIDIQGNSYIVGTINGVPDSKEFTINSNGGKDVFVAKFDAQGNQVWIENAGGAGDDYGLGIVVDEDANGDTVIFITGHLQMRETTNNGALVVHEVNFGDQLSYTASSGETSPFVAKISPDGEWAWATIGEGYLLESDSNDIAFDGSNRIYIGGRFSNYLNFTTVDKAGNSVVNSAYTGCSISQKMGFIGVFSANGQHVDTKLLNGCNTWINALEVRENSNIFVVGGFWGGATVANEQFIVESAVLGAPHGNGYYFNTNGDVDKNGNLIGSWSPVLEEAFIAALSPGVLDWSWARHITGMNRDRINDVVVDSNNDAIIGGNFMSNVSFVSPGADCSVNGNDFGTDKCLTMRSTGDYDMFIAKITSSGDWVYSDSNAGMAGYAPISATDFLQALTIDDNDNLYVMGSFLNNLYVGLDHLHATPYFPLYFVAKYSTSDINHDWQWGCQADRVPGYGSEGFTGWGLSRFGGIVVDENGIPIISGFFADSVRFDEDYISQDSIGEKINSAYIAKLSDYCAEPVPMPSNMTLGGLHRDDVRLLQEFTEGANQLVEDFDFNDKAVVVTVKSSGGYDSAISSETSARSHDKYTGFIEFGHTEKVMIVSAGHDLSSQALLDAPSSAADFSDFGITLASVSHDAMHIDENFTTKGNALQELIESGLLLIPKDYDEEYGNFDEEPSTEGRHPATRHPIKGYVYIRRSRRMTGLDNGEPTQSGVVAWGVRDDGTGNGYLVDDLPHSLEGIESEWNTPVAAGDIYDVCNKLLTTKSFLSEEDACISVIVEDLEKEISQDDGEECYMSSGPIKDQFYLTRDSGNEDSSSLESVKRIGDFSKFCSDSSDSNDGPDRGQQNCGFDVTLSDIGASTDMTFYETGDVVTATYVADCTVEPLSYTIKATTLRSNGEIVSVQDYTWTAVGTTQSFDEVHEKLDADVYCVEVELTEATTSISRMSTSCFVVSSSSSGTGGGNSVPGFTLLICISSMLLAGLFRIGRDENP